MFLSCSVCEMNDIYHNVCLSAEGKIEQTSFLRLCHQRSKIVLPDSGRLSSLWTIMLQLNVFMAHKTVLDQAMAINYAIYGLLMVIVLPDSGPFSTSFEMIMVTKISNWL